MAKDRASPFSLKHRRVWLTVTGGMIAIGVVNVGLGYLLWPDTPIDRVPERIIPELPGRTADAGPDATPAAADTAPATDAADTKDAPPAADARR